MKTLIPAIILIGIAVLGIAIKMIFIKGSTFTKTCGSVDPKTGQKVTCTCGDDGSRKKSDCENKYN
ncbi:MAG: membrane or secreted protein [Bacteroidales bacterium]|nr:MAG: membrane or secreted protein [Bacteroidales bacterium]